MLNGPWWVIKNLSLYVVRENKKNTSNEKSKKNAETI
jgi:hypothetical protein